MIEAAPHYGGVQNIILERAAGSWILANLFSLAAEIW
jgi:hypothetical protein